MQVDGKHMRRICTPAKVHNIYDSCAFVILLFIVDHDNDVPVVQVLILCLSTKDR